MINKSLKHGYYTELPIRVLNRVVRGTANKEGIP